MVGEHIWDLGDDPGTPATWEPAAREIEPAVEPPEGAIYLRVVEALPADVDRGIARVDPLAMAALGLAADQVVSITGRRSSLARVAEAGPSARGLIRLDGLLRDNTRAGLDGRVAVCRIEVPTARYLELKPLRPDQDARLDRSRLRSAVLDSLDDLSDVVVLAATKRLDLVDPALLSAGRLGYVVDFALPDEADRRAILEIHAGRLATADDLDLDALARDSQGLTGAQLAAVCQHAGMSELRALAPDALANLRVPHARFAEALEAVRRRHAVRLR
jgi:hypothetical protein